MGALYRRTEETHRLRLYESGEIARALRAAGLGPRLLRGYGRLRLPKGHLAVVARRAR